MRDDAVMSPERLGAEFAEWIARSGDSLSRFRDEHLSFEVALTVHRELQHLLWDAEWTRWGWPRESGGLGGTPRHRAVIYESLALAGIAVPEAFQILEVAGEAVQHFAPDVAARLLPRLIAGDDVWSLGLSEPDAGSDLAALRTRIALAGDGYAVTGSKTWNGFGHLADYSFALCRNEGPESRRNLTVALVDLRHPDAHTRPIMAMTGRNEFAEVFFDSVPVAADLIIGGIGNGWSVIAYMMQFERGTYAWPRQARLHRRLDDLIARHGEVVAMNPRRLGETFMDLLALRMKCRESLGMLAAEDSDGPGAGASVDKLLLVKAETSVAAFAHDVIIPDIELAGDGESARWRHDYLYVRALSIFGGTNEIQRNIVAEKLLGMPREVRR